MAPINAQYAPSITPRRHTHLRQGAQFGRTAPTWNARAYPTT